MWPYRVSKMSSVKADLAIYCHTVHASGHMSESLILEHNLDLSSCDIWSVFVNPVTYTSVCTISGCIIE